MERVVAIYARVSSEHEAQLSALANQVQYYDELLSRHPEWKLYDKYIDEGITGTSVKKRKSFMRMMKDADKGCFDLIVTREVSRFARNTVDTLQETRRLKKIGIEVYFTEDNIWTMNDDDGELRLTIMATLAQNESKKTSQRVKAGQMISFKNAIPYGTGNILGYDRAGKELVVNPDQAETVKLIFKMYLEGMGLTKIRYELEKLGRLTAMGLTKWESAVISRVLRNPFYCGTIVYRKAYVPDYLEQKTKKNRGEVEQIVVEGKHEPLVSKDNFAKVQEMMDLRVQKTQYNKLAGKKAPTIIWSKKLICQCGCSFNQKVWTKTPKGGKKYCFQCYSQRTTGSVATRKNKGLDLEGVCTVPLVPEWKMVLMFRMLMKALFEDKERVLKIANELLESNIHQAINKETRNKIKRYDGQLNTLKRKMAKLVDMRMSDEIEKELFLENKAMLDRDIEEVQGKLSKLVGQAEMTEGELKDKIKILEFAMNQDFNFDSKDIPDSIVDLMVKKVTVFDDHFEWKLNFFNEGIRCSVDGSKWNPIFTVLQNDCLGEGLTEKSNLDNEGSLPVLNDSGTGCYQR